MVLVTISDHRALADHILEVGTKTKYSNCDRKLAVCYNKHHNLILRPRLDAIALN